jgi:nucleoside-diphosphate-sugar epimerase
VKALVTGATGFTGGHLAKFLVARGDSVRVLVRSATQTALPALAGMEAVVGDLQATEDLFRVVDGVDVVYNVAALYRQAGLPEATYRKVNGEAPGAIVDACARAGVRRVVHCSTVGVHGDIEHPPADEDAPLRPGDVYQVTKLEGEERARDRARHGGVELVIVRPSGIYGAGDRRLLKLFRGVARRRFVVLGDGEIFYHLTHIDDLVEGFRLAATAAAAAGRTYILAGGEVTTLNELVRIIGVEAGVPGEPWHLPVWPFWLAGAACEALCAPFGIEPPLYRRRVDFFTKSRAFDITRARTELEFRPRVTLRDGVHRTLAWYRAEGWL